MKAAVIIVLIAVASAYAQQPPTPPQVTNTFTVTAIIADGTASEPSNAVLAAGAVELAFNASPDPRVIGYVLHVKNRAGERVYNIGNALTAKWPLAKTGPTNAVYRVSGVLIVTNDLTGSGFFTICRRPDADHGQWVQCKDASITISPVR